MLRRSSFRFLRSVYKNDYLFTARHFVLSVPQFGLTISEAIPEHQLDSSAKNLKTEWDAAKSFDQIPGHRSYPIVGTTWAMMGKDLPRFLEVHRAKANKFGPIWKEKIPQMPPLVITVNPEDAEKFVKLLLIIKINI